MNERLTSSVGADNFESKAMYRNTNVSKKRIDYLLKMIEERNRVRQGSSKEQARVQANQVGNLVKMELLNFRQQNS